MAAGRLPGLYSALAGWSSVISGHCRCLSASGYRAAMSTEYATGCNIYVKGEDPKLGSDDEYPEWLWTLLEPAKSTKQLMETVKEAGGYDTLSAEEFFRLEKLSRKAQIKAANLANKRKK